MQDNWPCILFAMAGGVVLSLGNLSTQYAWAFVGLSVTEVITSSITVVIGQCPCVCWKNFSFFSYIAFVNRSVTCYWNFVYCLNLLLWLLQAQPWITSWMTKLIKPRFFSLALDASWLLFALPLLFTRPMLLIIRQSLWHSMSISSINILKKVDQFCVGLCPLFPSMFCLLFCLTLLVLMENKIIKSGVSILLGMYGYNSSAGILDHCNHRALMLRLLPLAGV